MNKVLEVDLSRGKWKTNNLDRKLAEDYIGGRGFTSRIQYERLDSKTEPLGPENVLIFATGPLTGTPAASTARFTVGGKSPLTGLLGDSNAGGFWGPELKFAGYDMLIVTGKSVSPVYLSINDDQVEIMDARSLWGTTTFETETALKEEHGENVKIISIGQAGENLVRYASIMSETYHAAGRTGMGAVMGSKNLKAIAVKGSREVPITDPKKFKEAKQLVLKVILSDPISTRLAPQFGTLRYTAYLNEIGALSTRNWQSGVFEGIHNICGEHIANNYKVGTLACFACPIGCGQVVEIPERSFGGACVKLEYYPLISFSSKCGNDNVESVIKAVDLCNRYGLDTGSTGQAIAFAMECEEKGLLKKKEDSPIDLRWGNYRIILELVKMIAFREGFGNLLAEGIKSMSEEIGEDSKAFAIHVKGMSLPTIDPRAIKAYNLRYVVASRGGDHLRAQGIQGDLLDELPVSEAIRSLIFYEQACALVDIMGVCKFTYHTDSASLENARKKIEGLTALYKAATGDNCKPSSLFKVTMRIRDLDRMFNAREGISRKDDTLPKMLATLGK